MLFPNGMLFPVGDRFPNENIFSIRTPYSNSITTNMKNISRRSFLNKTAVGAAGVAALPLFQSFNLAANDTIRVGFIGLGQQAMNHLGGFSNIKNVEIVAGADVYGVKRERFEMRVRDFYKKRKQKVDVKCYSDYR